MEVASRVQCETTTTARANIDLPAAAGDPAALRSSAGQRNRWLLGGRRAGLGGSPLQLASRSVCRSASQPQGGLAHRWHINNDNNDNNNNEQSALASNQFSTCSIGKNVDDDGDDHHDQSLSGSVFSSDSDSASPSSSLLSHIDLAARSGSRRRRASASSVTLAATNNGPGDDCAADRCCCFCRRRLPAASGWCSMPSASGSSDSLIGVANANLPANATTDAPAALARSSPLCERNKYYTNHYNTNKTALFSCQDAPRSRRGATSTGNCESREREQKRERELDNSGTTIEPTATTTTSRARNTTSKPDKLDNSSTRTTTKTKLDQLLNLVVGGYDRPSSISGSLWQLPASCEHSLSALRRSRSCRDILYEHKANCHFHIYHQRKPEEPELDNGSNKTRTHDHTKASTSSTSLGLDHLLSSADQQGSVSEQSDQSSNVTTKPPTNTNNNNNNCPQTDPHQANPLSGARRGPKKEAAKLKQPIHSGNARSTSFGEVMAILQQLTIQDRLEAPKTYPNNTLIVDLNKCHNNVASLWPQPTTATRSAIKLSHLASFWSLLLGRKRASNEYERNNLQRPSKTAKKSRYKFPMPDPIAKTNVKVRT